MPATAVRQKQSHFPCEQCGADLLYSPSSQSLECNYCGTLNSVPITMEPIREYDLQQAIRDLERLGHKSRDVSLIKCPSCAAKFDLDSDVHSGDCPFCGTPVVTSTEQARPIRPRSLLPFSIDQDQAQAIFSQWMKTRWFAPSSLSSKARRDEKLTGVYLPYWTYDSDTRSRYQGQRGKVYYERRRVTAVVNGRRVTRDQMVPRVHWTPVAGAVGRHFDDVLIGATKTLPRAIIDGLAPWDLRSLVPYSEAYLSGFRSEIYQVTVDQGFLRAQQVMDHTIRQDVRRDIGGDQQRIQHVSTQHDNTRFKHLLLPVWSAAFKYRGKTYRYVINGRTGKVHGERPYSLIKIASAVALSTSVAGGGAYLVDKNGGFDNVSIGYPAQIEYEYRGYREPLPPSIPQFPDWNRLPADGYGNDPWM